MRVDLVRILDETAEACREATPGEWSDALRDDVLGGLTTVSYEIVDLAARIRAAKVNNTPVPHPVKPGPKPVEPPPPPVPDPAPEPPADGTGAGR